MRRNRTATIRSAIPALALATVLFIAAGCRPPVGGGPNDGGTDGGGGNGGASAEGYLVGGTVNALTANGLVLALNGSDTVTVDGDDDAFEFSTALQDGTSYSVSVSEQPGDGFQTCAVQSNATGTIDGSDVSDVVVQCSSDSTKLFALSTETFVEVDRGSSSFADVDRDGDQDLLITGGILGGETATLYENDGSGGFTDMGAGFRGVVNSASAFADVDGENGPDLVITGSSGLDQYATLYVNDGSGGFSTPGTTILETVNQGEVVFADFDGSDGIDFILTGVTDNPDPLIGPHSTVKLYMNTGDASGVFNEVTPTLTSTLQGSISVADVDGINGPDILITGNNNPPSGSATTVSKLYLNDGDGTFTDSGETLTEVKWSASAFADFDGDGDHDLVVAGYSASGSWEATLYVNNLSEGSFGLTATDAGLTGVSSSSASVADVDQDGDVDLLLAGWNGVTESATLYLNDGSGSFTPADTGLTGVTDNPSSAFADVDGDGDLDLVITGGDNINEDLSTRLYLNQLN